MAIKPFFARGLHTLDAFLIFFNVSLFSAYTNRSPNSDHLCPKKKVTHGIKGM
jgi:hypothetical protein